MYWSTEDTSLRDFYIMTLPMARKLVLMYWMLHKPWESEVCTEDFPNAYLSTFLDFEELVPFNRFLHTVKS